MKFTIYQESRIGRRRNNQDRIAHCYSRDALLMVLADGMGGHLHGEVAAQIAVQYLTEAFQREARPRLEDPFRFLANGLENAHRAIVDYTDERALPDAPRTTCVVCVVQDNIAYWAHAGDSRLYLLRGGRVVTRTIFNQDAMWRGEATSWNVRVESTNGDKIELYVPDPPAPGSPASNVNK